ncbi:bifunctional 3-(3-hydroxy-phenyl)propionate/3-hydroxycinnamic acid hydroxylase [Sphingomonas sp.]|uniref:bifunctional 3-(3-hydroxy-phenyl)propionate/3-hydroxycinnamic acid hydroxylase n=1 Tax=Sphingomonas sp. TaxID=28214 RepID=UPI0025E9C128|nr:bifunctional 3-(3-hydroxy-phenyl)propionate/3-hydroxycinnamic acid hydroxylase [Sphingomonas sp.]
MPPSPDPAATVDVDVLICGYGPVGAVAAALLAGRGLSVAVAERAAAIYDKPRAITGDHEIMRILQAAGVADELAPLCRAHRGTDYLGVDGEPIMTIDIAPPPYPLSWPTAFHFIQPELEALLREKVRSRGAEVLLSHEVASVVRDGDAAIADLVGPDGVTKRYRARYLLACDGANSAIRKSLGIGYEDLAFDQWWLVVDAWLLRETAMPARSTQYCRPSRPGTAVIGPRDLRRWEIKLLPGEDPDRFRDDAAVREVLATFVDVDAVDLWRSAVYRFHALVAERWRDGPIFLMGDSAHQMPPFMGQGMCAGVRDAANLAWKILAVEEGRAGAALLDTYELERKPHVKRLVGLSKERGLIIGELDEQAAIARDARLREEGARGAIERVRHRYIPGLIDGAIARDASGAPMPGAGSLFVQPDLQVGIATRRLDDVVPGAFLLIAREPETLTGLSAAARATLAASGSTIAVLRSVLDRPRALPVGDGDQVLVETGDVFRAWMEEAAATAVLVRPDRYVFGFANDDSSLEALIGGFGATLAAAPPVSVGTQAPLQRVG